MPASNVEEKKKKLPKQVKRTKGLKKTKTKNVTVQVVSLDRSLCDINSFIVDFTHKMSMIWRKTKVYKRLPCSFRVVRGWFRKKITRLQTLREEYVVVGVVCVLAELAQTTKTLPTRAAPFGQKTSPGPLLGALGSPRLSLSEQAVDYQHHSRKKQREIHPPSVEVWLNLASRGGGNKKESQPDTDPTALGEPENRAPRFGCELAVIQAPHHHHVPGRWRVVLGRG